MPTSKDTLKDRLARYRQIKISVIGGWVLQGFGKLTQIPNSSLAVVPRPPPSVPAPLER
jgi:hypothetical protein